jgi:hypothetical protein
MGVLLAGREGLGIMEHSSSSSRKKSSSSSSSGGGGVHMGGVK